MSLIDLNNTEIKKNEMRPMLSEEMRNAKGGYKCHFVQCLCSCINSDTQEMYYQIFYTAYTAIRDEF